MDIEQQDRITSGRLARLREAQAALKERRDKAASDLALRVEKLDLLEENTANLAATEERRLAAMSEALVSSAQAAATRYENLDRLPRILPGGRRLRADAALALREQKRFEADLPMVLARVRQEARNQARTNVILNVRKRRVLGSLPRIVEMMDHALEAVSKGDPAVCTCLLRGQLDRALQVASTWMRRRKGETVSSAELGEYLSAYAEKDADYESEEQAAKQVQEGMARMEMIERGIQELRLRSIMETLQRGRPIVTVDADWEEVTPNSPLMLRDDSEHGSTP